MKYFIAVSCIIIITVGLFLLPQKKQSQIAVAPLDSAKKTIIATDSAAFVYGDGSNSYLIHTNNTDPQDIVAFAKTLIGIPYVYASAEPAVGFDCSGFITYVFNHFNIPVPRSSVDFTNVQYEVPVGEAKPADLILFTGTDSTIRVVGHMGIVVQNENNELQFIHSTSGKADAVTITPLNDYYKGRFVKILRIFPQNGLPSAGNSSN